MDGARLSMTAMPAETRALQVDESPPAQLSLKLRFTTLRWQILPSCSLPNTENMSIKLNG